MLLTFGEEPFKFCQNLFFFLDVNFENLTIELRVIYILNTHVKFCLNWMLFTIQLINLFLFINLDDKNIKFKHLIDVITIYLWTS